MNDRRIHVLLGCLVALDTILVTWAGAFPALWYEAFHGVPYDDPQGYLRRCAANWAAFLLFQAIAFVRWKRDVMWLAIVAGIRLSDIFTDVTDVLIAENTTWFAQLTLAPMSAINLIIGLVLIRAYRQRTPHPAPATVG